MLFSVHNSDVTKESFSNLLIKSMSDSHLLLGVSMAYLMIANKKRWKKHSLWVKNYLKTQNFGIIDDLQLDEDI